MIKEENRIVAERLKEAMNMRHVQQKDIVENTGINKGALSSYLNGAYKPKQKNLYLLSSYLNVSEAWLMGLDVPMGRGTVNLKDNPGVAERWTTAIAQQKNIPFEELWKIYLNIQSELVAVDYDWFTLNLLDTYYDKETYFYECNPEEKEKLNKKGLNSLKVLYLINELMTEKDFDRLDKLIELTFPELYKQVNEHFDL